MFRKVVGPITCCLFLTWGVLAAPRKYDSSSGYYLSTMVGDKVVMESDDGEQRWETTCEVTEVRQKDAVVLVTFRDSGDRDGPYRYEASDRGVYKVRVNGDGVEEARFCQVKLPFKKGDTWETTAKNVYGDTVTMRYTSAGEEVVEVPAGKFRCLRVEAECMVRGCAFTMTSWTAPRWGAVKHVTVGKDSKGKLTDYVCVGVLKSFSPGGN